MAPGRIAEEPSALHGVINGEISPESRPYIINEVPLGTRRPLRIVCMGAGYSGIMMGIIVSARMQNDHIDFVMYERNPELGGTWLENKYPGCQCDIPAHNYAYSFEPNPEWPNYYATSPMILEYLKKVSQKYDVDRYMKFNHSIQRAEWDETRGKWIVEVVGPDGKPFVDECDVFINAAGILNKWQWPNVEGLGAFQGKKVHSAKWDTDYDFSGKRIAVIGIGSSGIQIVPQLAKEAGSLTHFIRTQVWVSPAPGINEPTENDPEMDENYNYSEAVLKEFKENPYDCMAHRRALADRRSDNFKRAWTADPMQAKAQQVFKKSMEDRLGDSEKGKKIASMLLPQFPVGCRRQTPGPGFLEALMRDNVDVRWDDIDRITEKGIKLKSGGDMEFDVIVFATGFDTSFRPQFPLIGRKGENLRKKWDDEAPEAYFGITIPGFPNYFTFIGPNSPVSNGSLVQGIQLTAVYIYNCLNKMQTEGIRSLCISQDATNDFNEHTKEYLKRTVWVGGCRSWYKRGTVDGQVVAVYGGTSFHMIEALRRPRWEDYELDYVGPRRPRGKGPNRFAYLGNGLTRREEKRGSVGDTQTLNFDDYWRLFVLPELYD